jgi:hypothetical protein
MAIFFLYLAILFSFILFYCFFINYIYNDNIIMKNYNILDTTLDTALDTELVSAKISFITSSL